MAGHEHGDVVADSGTFLSGNIYLDSLLWSSVAVEGLNVTFAFAGEGSFSLAEGTVQTLDWPGDQKQAVVQALQAWANVLNLTFTQTTDLSTATFKFLLLSDETTTNVAGQEGVLGFAVPQGNPDAGVAAFNAEGASWTAAGLRPGGDGFQTLVHEIGHLLGLDHPFNDDSDPHFFPGAIGLEEIGENGLNQGIFTALSYNGGWTGQPAAGLDSGREFGPMAFDIAAGQRMYGANNGHRAGDDMYVLPGSDGAGTGWLSIWDTGGVDTIASPSEAGPVTIDLRPALLDGATPGGFVSWMHGVPGGFTIATGTIVENAVGGSGRDALVGNDTNNRFTGGLGDDEIRGGLGIDTAAYSASRDQYTTQGSGGSLTVSGTDGTDTLTEIERLAFSDGMLAFDLDGNAGQGYRIYQAAFDRVPDPAGLSHWVRALDDGATLSAVAQGFLGSAEFQALYGVDPSEQDYLRLLYRNVLDRDPDQAGYDYWQVQVDAGLGRADMLKEFSESNENQQKVIGSIQGGIWLEAYAVA